MKLSKLKIFNMLGIGIILSGFSFVMWESNRQDTQAQVLKTPAPYSSTNLSYQAIQPIPLLHNLNPKIVALGDDLFHDNILTDKGINCASCHNLKNGGIDGRPVSVNIQGGSDFMNTPTVFNSSLNFLFMWNGRDTTLEQQLNYVLSNSKHMGTNWDDLLHRLSMHPDYKQRFNALYETGITRHTVTHAITTFERSLITPNSPFDQYLRGDENAISEDQKSGYLLFKHYGCISCHQGINLGGNTYAKLGTFKLPKKEQHTGEEAIFDLGKYNHTGNDSDKGVFRVPSLRNIDKTAPYFHDGEVKSLERAIKLMARYQIGQDINKEEIHLIASFLRSLTGEYKGQPL